MARRYDLVIIGMGSGGMVAAEFAAKLKLKVAVVERGRVGGDCLWTGCVPSKALLASAKVAHHLRTADRWGLPATDPAIDTAAVWRRIRAVQHDIAATDDNPDRFRALGVELVTGTARVSGPHRVEVGGRTLQTRYVLLCTGSRPATPPIPGLVEARYLTSENVFEIDKAPARIVAIGGGPIAIELAQGLNRLGVKVTVLQKGPGILPRDEPELVAILTRRLRAEGVDVRLDVDIERVAVTDDGAKVVHGTQAGEPTSWEADELLVGVGRRPNVEGLGLEDVGVEIGQRGVKVDDRMRSTVPSIYAAGDVAGRFLFTHSAGHEAVRAVRDMFFPGRGTVSDLVPWCTFTDPELAHAGLTEGEARKVHGEVQVHRMDLSHSDRARADGDVEGRIVAVCGPKGRLVGAGILAAGAGEMIHELALLIKDGRPLTDLSSLIHVYPTRSTSIGQLAAEATFASALRLVWVTRLTRLWPFGR